MDHTLIEIEKAVLSKFNNKISTRVSANRHEFRLDSRGGIK